MRRAEWGRVDLRWVGSRKSLVRQEGCQDRAWARNTVPPTYRRWQTLRDNPLAKNKFWNNPFKNPTQNMFVRFNKMPGGELRSMITRGKTKYEDSKDFLNSRYGRYIGDF
jgi:hypothetical protein